MKKYILIFLIAFVTGFVNQSMGQLKPPPPINPNIPNQWTAIAPMDTGLHSPASFSIGTKIYIVVGDTTSQFFRGRLVPTTWAYDTVAKTWARRAPFPGKLRIGAVGFSIGNKGYIGGGRNFGKPDSLNNTINLNRDTFKVISTAPKTWERIDTALTYTNAKGDSVLNDFWEYDPAGNTWTKKADIPGTKMGRAYPVGFSMNGKGYIGLGYDNEEIKGTVTAPVSTVIGPYIDSIVHTQTSITPPKYKIDTIFRQVVKTEIDSVFTDDIKYLKDMYEYDPTSNTWTKKADFPGQPRAYASAMPLYTSVAIGLGTGDSVPSVMYDDFYLFDPSGNSWVRTTDFPASKRFGASSFSLGFLGYIAGGFDGLPRKDFYEYNNIAKTWDRLPNLPDSARSLGLGGILGKMGYFGIGAGVKKSYDNIFKWVVDTNRVTIKNIPSGPFCGGEIVSIDYEVSNGVSINTGNNFTIQISDSTGSFFFPVTCSVVPSTSASGTLNFTIPISTVEGKGYKFRVIASNPNMTGNPTLASYEVRQVPSINTGPFADSTCIQAGSIIRIDAVGTDLTYQWKKNGVNLSNGANISGVDNDSLIIASASLSDAGNYSVEISGACSPKVTSNAVSLVVQNIPPPTITLQPVKDTVCEGSSKSFTINATGTKLNYRWMKGNDTLRNGPFIVGAASPTLTISPTRLIDSGSYRCIVFENCGSRTVSSSAKLNFYLSTQILEQPVNVDTVEFVDIGFKVKTIGNNNKFQWFKGNTLLNDGTKYDGTKTDSLTIKNLIMSDVGFYRVEVTGDCGATQKSLLGLLEIDPMPVITQQPDSTSDCEGSTVFFSVKVDGAGINYIWRKNGTPLNNIGNISGADTRTLVISGISAGDNGTYDCEVSTGPYTKVVSDPATLLVKPVPPKPVVGSFGANFIQSSISGDVYRWYLDNIFEPTLTGQTVKVTKVGDYRVRVTKDGCISPLSDPYFWFPTTGIADVNAGSINLYPNPATTSVDVEIPSTITNGTIKVFDIVGKQVSVVNVNNATTYKLNISSLSQGMYYITVSAADGTTFVGKLVKE